MADSNPLKIEFDGDGAPSGLGEFRVGDTIVNSILPSGVQQVVRVVEDSSGLWNEGGEATIPDAVSGLWQQTYVNVRDTSADLIEASSTLNSFSGSVETSTATLDSRVDIIEPLVPSALGFAGWDSTKSTVDSGAPNWNVIYGDRANIQSISGTVATSATAFLTGANPTASVSAITVSACPVPAPWVYVQQTDNLQSTADQTDFYFGGNAADAGNSPATTSFELSPELITWVPTSFPEHILIAVNGYYEVIFNGSFYLPAGATNPTTITQSLQTSALSSETTRISKVLQMRNNAEPTDAGLHWIGYLGIGDKIGIHITANATTNLRKGSTLTCKRIN